MGWLIAIGAAVWFWAKSRAGIEAPPRGSGAPRPEGGDTPEPEQACDEELPDGEYTICLLYGSGAWRATVRPTPPGGWIAPHGFPLKVEALAAAWTQLKEKAPIVNVVPDLVARHGLSLRQDGTVEITDLVAYTNFAAPIVSAAVQKGDDSLGVVLAVLIAIFGQRWNPLRVRLKGTDIWAAVARVANVADKNPVKIARAIVGAPA